jgi:hypothetical protein
MGAHSGEQPKLAVDDVDRTHAPKNRATLSGVDALIEKRCPAGHCDQRAALGSIA